MKVYIAMTCVPPRNIQVRRGLFGGFKPLSDPGDGIIGFMPVFQTKEDAEKWAKGRYKILEAFSFDKII